MRVAATDRTLAAVVWASLFLAQIATHSGHLYSVDGLMYYRTADRLATAGSLTFDPPIRWGTGDPIRESIAPIGLSLALLPAIILGEPFRAQQPPPSEQAYDPALLYGDGFYAAVSWINPALAALAGALVLMACRWLGAGRRLAVVAGIATVIAGPLLWYGRADYPQALTTVLLLGGILLALRARRTGRGASWLAPIVAAAILTRPVDGGLTALVLAAGLMVPAVGDRRDTPGSIRAVVPVGLGVALGGLGSLVVNVARRGTPLDFGYGAETFNGFLPAGILAYLISPGRSFIWHMPLVVVGSLGAVALWRARDRVAFTLLALPFLLWLIAYGQWGGLSGWAYGPRFLVPLVPLAVILAAIAVAHAAGPWPGRLFALAATAGVLLAISSVVVDQFYVFGDIGANRWGTVGFWREFSVDAYAPIASWSRIGPTFLGYVPDIWWFRQAEATRGVSLIVPLVLGPLAIALGLWAWRLAGDASTTERAAIGCMPPG